jgi:hypothetical protein
MRVPPSHAQLLRHASSCAFVYIGRRRKIRCDSMPGASVCFNCKSRRTPCVSQAGGDGARLSLRRRPDSDSPRNSSSSEAPTWAAARDPGVPQAPHVLENSATDQRAPFLAVLDPSGVSPPMFHWHAVVRSADLTSKHSSPTLPRRTMLVRHLGQVWPGTAAVCLTRQQVAVGHLVFPADYCLSHSHPARGKEVYARHYVQDYRPTILS